MEPGNHLVSFVLLLVSAFGDCLSSDKCDHEQLLSALNGFGACTGIGAYTFHIPFIYLSYILHCKTGCIIIFWILLLKQLNLGFLKPSNNITYYFLPCYVWKSMCPRSERKASPLRFRSARA